MLATDEPRMTAACAEPACLVFYPWYCGAIRGHNSYPSSTTEWQKNLGAKRWIREKLCSAISNGDFFALLFFCLPLGSGRRPRDAVGQHLLPACCRSRNAFAIKGLHPRDLRSPRCVWHSGNVPLSSPPFAQGPRAGEFQFSQCSMAFTVARIDCVGALRSLNIMFRLAFALLYILS